MLTYLFNRVRASRRWAKERPFRALFVAFFAICAFLAASLLPHAAAVATTPLQVTVTIEPIRKLKGTVSVELCPEDEYKNGDCLRTLRVPVAAAKVDVTFADIPAGNYAVRVLQDFNGDNVMDQGFLGFPKEPFGYSRLSRFPLREPRFKDISFLVTSPLAVTVRLLNQG